MNKNSITITIENYKGKKLIYSAPVDALVDIMKARTINLDGTNDRLTNINIELMCETGITEKEEDLK